MIIVTEGPGMWMQRAGSLLPMLNGLMLIRAARQSSTKQSLQTNNKWLKQLVLVDRYPIASSGVIGGIGVATIAGGALSSGE